MKRYALHLLLILSVPVWLMFAAAAQESGGYRHRTETRPRLSAGTRERGRRVEKPLRLPTGTVRSRPTATTDDGEEEAEKQADRKKKTARKPAAAEEEAEGSPGAGDRRR